ncbi:GDP-mannose 4,6-dehydratase [Pseudahrensia aquimaris]|uniref:GDP-mannose 4,6-dehydratase n=1 Tax=Pseudahrensia aquimaris TaxID=744461 RepID=A0ABW3FK31_9HYPH
MSVSNGASHRSDGERWFITGGCGFIGRNLISLLLGQGVPLGSIRVYDNHSAGSLDDLKHVTQAAEEGADWGSGLIGVWQGDVRDALAVGRAMQGSTHVVHLAASTSVTRSVEDPLTDCQHNVLGVLTMLEQCRTHPVEAFVFASSSAPLGAAAQPITEETPPNPASPYGASKLAGEGYCQAYANCFDVPTSILRFGNVYGIHCNHTESVVARFLLRALEGLPLEIYGDGTATRDFVYVEDLCEAIALAARQARTHAGEIYQIATHRETTVNEIANILASVLKDQGVEGVTVNHAQTRVGDVQRNFSDVAKAKRDLGWEARTSLQEGLSKTADWFLQNSR